MKVCKKCQTRFDPKGTKRQYCSKLCQRKSSREQDWFRVKSNPKARLKQLLIGAKNRAGVKNIPFNLTHDYLIDLWENQSGLCVITNQSFNLTAPDEPGIARHDAPSLDRIVPSLGYVEGNVRIIWYQVNMSIGYYGLEQFFKMVQHVQEHGGLG